MKIQGVKVKGQADVVIASPGGFPKDINLYQGSKTYDTAEMALKPGGIVISLLEAREVNDPPEYMQSFRYDDLIEMEKAVRAKFTIPFFIAYRLFLLCQKSTVYIVTKKENFEAVRKTARIPVEPWLKLGLWPSSSLWNVACRMIIPLILCSMLPILYR